MTSSSSPLAAHLAMLATREGQALMIGATRDRIGGSRLAHIRAWMHETDARCVSCGHETRTDVPASHPRHAELGHLIAASTYAASNARVGFVPGNIGLMCHTCNADANKESVSFTEDMLIEDAFIPMMWPAGNTKRNGTESLAMESRNSRKW